MKARTQHILASTFLRFQEHYESPEFRRKIFDLEEYMDWYARTNGAFSYYTDWSGFNIPSHILAPFREGKFNPLSRKEHRLLEVLDSIPEPFYVIGASNPLDMDVVKHEIVHGLFYTDQMYQKKVLEQVRCLSITTFRKALKKIGYCEEVMEDEINAYAVTNLDWLFEYGLNSPEAAAAKSVLRSLFQNHFGFSIKRASAPEILALVREKEM